MIVEPTRETSSSGTRPKPRTGRRGLLAFFSLIAVLVAAAVVGGILPRLTRNKALLAAAETQTAQRPLVEVATARLAPARSTLDLPGDMLALVDSPIFARVDGYLRTRLVDYGDRVKAGQLLAEIDTPELDQQIRQARATILQSQSALNEVKADLDLSKANLNMARLTVDRWRRLVKRGVVAQQEADQKEADFAVTEAQVAKAQATIATTEETVHANEANLHRLEEMKAFARIMAPFDGVITSRNCGHRLAGQLRQQRHRPRAVPHRADPGVAHLRQRAADQCGFHASRPDRRTARGGTARPGFRRARHAHRQRTRRQLARHADRARSAQSAAAC